MPPLKHPESTSCAEIEFKNRNNVASLQQAISWKDDVFRHSSPFLENAIRRFTCIARCPPKPRNSPKSDPIRHTANILRRFWQPIGFSDELRDLPHRTNMMVATTVVTRLSPTEIVP
jgi:hypothetical protein